MSDESKEARQESPYTASLSTDSSKSPEKSSQPTTRSLKRPAPSADINFEAADTSSEDPPNFITETSQASSKTLIKLSDKLKSNFSFDAFDKPAESVEKPNLPIDTPATPAPIEKEPKGSLEHKSLLREPRPSLQAAKGEQSLPNNPSFFGAIPIQQAAKGESLPNNPSFFGAVSVQQAAKGEQSVPNNPSFFGAIPVQQTAPERPAEPESQYDSAFKFPSLLKSASNSSPFPPQIHHLLSSFGSAASSSSSAAIVPPSSLLRFSGEKKQKLNPPQDSAFRRDSTSQDAEAILAARFGGAHIPFSSPQEFPTFESDIGTLKSTYDHETMAAFVNSSVQQAQAAIEQSRKDAIARATKAIDAWAEQCQNHLQSKCALWQTQLRDMKKNFDEAQKARETIGRTRSVGTQYMRKNSTDE